VHAAWRAGHPIATLLTLDVTGAYDNVSHQTAAAQHGETTSTNLYYQLDSKLPCQSQDFDTPTGGRIHGAGSGHRHFPVSPLSPILYLFCNADMLESLPHEVLAVGYVDNICFLTRKPTVRENYNRLRRLRAGRAAMAGSEDIIFFFQVLLIVFL
jgi:hypothetical protein